MGRRFDYLVEQIHEMRKLRQGAVAREGGDPAEDKVVETLEVLLVAAGHAVKRFPEEAVDAQGSRKVSTEDAWPMERARQN